MEMNSLFFYSPPLYLCTCKYLSVNVLLSIHINVSVQVNVIFSLIQNPCAVLGMCGIILWHV